MKPLLDNEYVEFNDENIYETAVDNANSYGTTGDSTSVKVGSTGKKLLKFPSKIIKTAQKYKLNKPELDIISRNSKVIRIIILSVLIFVITTIIINNTYNESVDAGYKDLNKIKEDRGVEETKVVDKSPPSWVYSIGVVIWYVLLEIFL